MKGLILIAYACLTLYFFIHNLKSCNDKCIILAGSRWNASVVDDDYYNLQLEFAIFNLCTSLILIGIFAYGKIDTILFMVTYPNIHNLINYRLKSVAIKKGYLTVN